METTVNATLNDSAGDQDYQCSGATRDELRVFEFLSFWMGGILQAIICLVGLAANTLSIPILKAKDLYTSTFNRLLIVLAVIDNAYLILALLESMRNEMGLATDAHTAAFAFALYPLHNIMLCLSIYMTVVLAMERHRAVSKPIDYHTVIVSGRQWQRVFHYVGPVLAFSIVFNMPKFFELRAEGIMGNDTSGSRLNLMIVPTELRLRDDYTIHYIHNLRIVFTGFVPLVALVFFNYRIYCAFKQRRNNMRGLASASNQQANEENRQAIVLFSIVVLFFICHILRNFLSLHEALTFEQKKQDYFHGCGGMPLWILIIGLISHLLLSCNSAFNFFLYCAMSDQFRNELKRLLRIHPTMANHSSNTNNGSSASRTGAGNQHGLQVETATNGKERPSVTTVSQNNVLTTAL